MSDSIEDSLMQPNVDLDEKSVESAMTKTKEVLKNLKQQSQGQSRYLREMTSPRS
jgi:hypothetical protein